MAFSSLSLMWQNAEGKPFIEVSGFDVDRTIEMGILYSEVRNERTNTTSGNVYPTTKDWYWMTEMYFLSMDNCN